MADYAVHYPFAYRPEDWVVLSAYMNGARPEPGDPLAGWLAGIWNPGERIQTYALLQRLGAHIQQTLSYRVREEPGVQSPAETLSRGTGSCRDFANLFMQAARRLGLAARFVSGYLHAEPSPANFGATHAWAEVFLPGAGWKGTLAGFGAALALGGERIELSDAIAQTIAAFQRETAHPWRESARRLEAAGWTVDWRIAWVAEARRGTIHEQAVGRDPDDAFAQLWDLTLLDAVEGCP